MLGLKGMQIEQHAQEVMAYCAQLQNDFGKFKEDFELVGTHVGRAQNKSATRRSGWGDSSASSSRPARLRPSYPRRRTSSLAPSTPPSRVTP